MRVELKLFAALREQLGTAHETLDVPFDSASVKDVRQWLAQRSPAWHEALSSPRVRIALNQQMVSDAARIDDGAELAFFPPVTGG